MCTYRLYDYTYIPLPLRVETANHIHVSCVELWRKNITIELELGPMSSLTAVWVGGKCGLTEAYKRLIRVGKLFLSIECLVVLATDMLMHRMSLLPHVGLHVAASPVSDST